MRRTTWMFVCGDRDVPYFVLVDLKKLQKAQEVVQTITGGMGLVNWEYAKLDNELMEKFSGHKREILYRADESADSTAVV